MLSAWSSAGRSRSASLVCVMRLAVRWSLLEICASHCALEEQPARLPVTLVVGLTHDLREPLGETRLLLADRAHLAPPPLAPPLQRLIDRPLQCGEHMFASYQPHHQQVCRVCAEMQRLSDSQSTRRHPRATLARMQTGEVGIEITPILDAPSIESEFAAQVDALLRRTCRIARALTGAEQAALKLWVGEDSSQARKYFSLSEKYAAFREFRVDPKGYGLHGMAIPPGEVVRLTEAEVLSHPLWRGFGSLADAHPPMRGWLATSVCGDDGRVLRSAAAERQERWARLRRIRRDEHPRTRRSDR